MQICCGDQSGESGKLGLGGEAGQGTEHWTVKCPKIKCDTVFKLQLSV